MVSCEGYYCFYEIYFLFLLLREFELILVYIYFIIRELVLSDRIVILDNCFFSIYEGVK